MSEATRKTVLISEPQTSNQIHYLPYMWAILKSWCERQTHLQGQFQWLEPLHWLDDPAALLAPYRDHPPDVLGLSCYVWNWDLQCQIAARVKALNPRCLVVAGGPQPDYKDPQFFRKYPFIDLVVVKDGEITFSKILTKVLADDQNYREIGGLYLPSQTGAEHLCTGPAEVPTVFDHSPYLDQSDWFEKLSAGYEPGHFFVLWETNRGCPYSCSFCDWGSDTMSKVRPFALERIKAEIAWFARMKVGTVMLADANFGILSRDPEIADLFIEARAKHGWPRNIYYSRAKNNPERTVEIARKLWASGAASVHTMALQHTRKEVLAGVDRANISVEKQRQVASALVAQNIPTVAQLIVGIPGDTCDLWIDCLTDLMDWGLHNNYLVFNYSLLPNAPAADKAYQEQWEIEAISRSIPLDQGLTRKKEDQEMLSRVDFIIRSKTYSRKDWVRMKVWAALVRALHNHGLTRLIAIYLHFSHAVSYREFYEPVIEDWLGRSEIYQMLSDHFHQFLESETVPEDMEIPQFSQQRWCIEPGRWAAAQFCLEFNRYFADLKAYLLARFPTAINLESAIDYQRNVIILPDYDSDIGKSFRTDFDWIGYFEKACLLTSYEPLGEPAPTPQAVVEVTDRIGANWNLADAEERWLAWLHATGEVQMTINPYFRELRLHRRPIKKLLALFRT